MSAFRVATEFALWVAFSLVILLQLWLAERYPLWTAGTGLLLFGLGVASENIRAAHQRARGKGKGS